MCSFAGLVGCALPCTAGSRTERATGSESLPYPESIRIPLTQLPQHGVTATVTDVASVPAGSIVAQSKAEQVAVGPVASATVYGSVLARLDSNFGEAKAGTLVWIVSIIPPSGGIGPDCPGLEGQCSMDPSVRTNVDDVFIDATTGQYVASAQFIDPALPPFPTPGAPAPSLGTATQGS